MPDKTISLIPKGPRTSLPKFDKFRLFLRHSFYTPSGPFLYKLPIESDPEISREGFENNLSVDYLVKRTIADYQATYGLFGKGLNLAQNPYIYAGEFNSFCSHPALSRSMFSHSARFFRSSDISETGDDFNNVPVQLKAEEMQSMIKDNDMSFIMDLGQKMRDRLSRRKKQAMNWLVKF